MSLQYHQSLERVILGGVEQWVLIKGTELQNPVLLFLHGGPGFPVIPFSHGFSNDIYEHFTVIYWDQRGAGKSYSESLKIENMTIEQFVKDTHELTQWLMKRFKIEKIFLAGHSWGGIIGINVVHEHPEDYKAYIGIGQVVNPLEADLLAYEFVRQKAMHREDYSSIDQLEMIGKPPYDIENTYRKNGLVIAYGGGIYEESNFNKLGIIAKQTPHYTKDELNKVDLGVSFSFGSLFHEISKIDFIKTTISFDIPMYFCSGKMDYLVPHTLNRKYFEIIKAPYKKFILLQKSAHFPHLEQPEEFANLLITMLWREKS